MIKIWLDRIIIRIYIELILISNISIRPTTSSKLILRRITITGRQIPPLRVSSNILTDRVHSHRASIQTGASHPVENSKCSRFVCRYYPFIAGEGYRLLGSVTRYPTAAEPSLFLSSEFSRSRITQHLPRLIRMFSSYLFAPPSFISTLWNLTPRSTLRRLLEQQVVPVFLVDQNCLTDLIFREHPSIIAPYV